MKVGDITNRTWTSSNPIHVAKSYGQLAGGGWWGFV
jgi:hypothetical protein